MLVLVCLSMEGATRRPAGLSHRKSTLHAGGLHGLLRREHIRTTMPSQTCRDSGVETADTTPDQISLDVGTLRENWKLMHQNYA